MSKLITKCPSCNNKNLLLTNIQCTDCHTEFKGRFDIPPLLKLSAEEIQFITEFVKCSGSLKEMAAQQGVSYPTLRNRLNELIENITALQGGGLNSKTAILEQVEAGLISVDEAAKRLAQLGGN